ncbi:MAG: hypothetical protein HY898_01160 [Deltaproteobacteria bacterium]|nr:hypothetical protein [Deltaproteobacteria bacterium]
MASLLIVGAHSHISKRAHRVAFVFAVVASACACTSSSSDAPRGDAGTDASDSTETGTDSCEHYFLATHSRRCGGPVLPAAELDRIHARWIQACANQLQLPGSGITPVTLDACASALETVACLLQGPPAACQFHGALPKGAACNEDSQCQSGRCVNTETDLPSGYRSPLRCGTCVGVVDVGQPCGQDLCPAGAGCFLTDPASNAYVCFAVTEGEAGAGCDQVKAWCKPGLYCDAQSSQCTPLHELGATCTPYGPSGCQPPLICSGNPATCVEPGQVGAKCKQSVDCAPGLGCAYLTTHLCSTVTWVGPGEPCSDTSLCLVGSCPQETASEPDAGSQTKCPTLLADGQSCDNSNGQPSTCDTFSVCMNGTCNLLDSFVCQ